LAVAGQAESGKSTLLKNFQLQFTPKAFNAEAEAWRTGTPPTLPIPPLPPRS
jgi:hypothetical protein